MVGDNGLSLPQLEASHSRPLPDTPSYTPRTSPNLFSHYRPLYTAPTPLHLTNRLEIRGEPSDSTQLYATQDTS